MCSRGPESVGRLAVEGLGASSWRLGEPEPAATAAIVRAVMHLKRLVQSSRCAAVVSVPAGGAVLSCLPMTAADALVYPTMPCCAMHLLIKDKEGT